MHSILLAFDIGTSGLKASLVDENLNIIRNVTTTYPTHHYPDGGCEQESADWWMSAVRAMMMLRELAPEYVKRVDAIGVSGHMLGCLPMDKEGQTLRPAMIHADTRALTISNALRARFGRDYFYEICGNVLSPASTLCKTLWLKENEPELYARTYRILQSKDYLVYRLTGQMETTDMSDASHGLLMNLETRQYDADMFRNVGLDLDKFPQIHTSCEIAGRLCEEAAGCLGLRAGIPVSVGGGAKSKLGKQILADVCNVTLHDVSTFSDSATSLGAAAAAGVAIGLFKNLPEACSHIRMSGDIEPDASVRVTYALTKKRYAMLYPSLKEVFHTRA